MKTKSVAKKLENMGTGDDTILAHINPEEAAMLKMHGGSGKTNPKTGLLSFSYEGDVYGGDGYPGDGPAGFGGGGYGGDVYGGVGYPGDKLAGNIGPGMPGYGMGPGPTAPAVPPSMMDSILAAMGKLPGTIGMAGKIGNYINNEVTGRGTGVSGGGGNDAYGINWGGGNFGVAREGNGFSGLPDNPYNSASGLLNQPPPVPVAGLPAPTASPFTPRPFTPKFGRPRGLLSTDMRGFLGG